MPLPIHRLVAALGASVLSSQPVWPWGNESHQTVGAVAEQLLQQHPTPRDRVKQISGNAPLSQAAACADCAKGPYLLPSSAIRRGATSSDLKG